MACSSVMEGNDFLAANPKFEVIKHDRRKAIKAHVRLYVVVFFTQTTPGSALNGMQINSEKYELLEIF
jgi:hypothetical protein